MNHDLSDSLVAPRAFGPFRVLHQIGVGVLGPVYRAQGEALDELVAIKAFRLDIPPEQAAEVANALIALKDDWPIQCGLAELVAAGLEGETPWLALPHLSTPTLDTRLREARPSPANDIEDALALIRGLAIAIDAAHARGIVHGSLHPRDVFVGAGGLARVTGFGIAAALARVGIRPPARRPYSAPETLEGARVAPPADLFALGALAFEVLTGRRPAGLGADAASHLDLPCSAEAISHARTIVAAMLADQPAHRPGSAVAFAQALAQALLESTEPRLERSTVAAFHRSESAASNDEPPSDDALRLFATQGTLWEAPRPIEPWADAAGSDEPTQPRVPDDEEETIVEIPDAVSPDENPLDAFAQESVPAPVSAPVDARPAPTEDTEVREAAAGAVLGLSAGAAQESPAAHDEPRDRHDQLRDRRDEPRDRHDELREPGSERRFVSAEEPPASHVRAMPEPEAESSSPPALVLALTLALGLAVGGAGGYLLGLRGAGRVDDTSGVGAPAATEEARDTAEAPPAADAADRPLPRDQPSTVDETVPPSDDAAAPAAPRTATPSSKGETSASSRRAATTGELLVRSTPAKAGVIINNTWRGRTPLTLRGLAFGTHTVRVIENGYAAETRRVSLDARVPSATVAVQLTRTAPASVGSAAPAPAQPGATTGSVYVQSRPTGARVILDGRFVGSTPLLISELSPGARALRLEYPGYQNWTTTIQVAAGRRQRVAASLEEEPEN